MSTDLIARLRARKTATAWTRGIDTDYPTAWAPDPDCRDAADLIEQQAAEIARLQTERIDRLAWMPVAIEPRPACCDRGATWNCCDNGCQQDRDEEQGRKAWAAFDAAREST